MAPMWKATIRGISARKVRLALTALAVVLGVAFVSGTYVLTDTLRGSFDLVFSETLSGVDVVVHAPSADAEVEVFGGGLLGTSTSSRLPDSVVDEVRAVDGVAAAEGLVQGFAQFVDHDGDAIHNGIAPTLGLSWLASDGVGPTQLVDDGRSRPPRRDGQVAMDAGTAREHGFEVGDRVDVLLQGAAEEFEIVGLFGFGDTLELGGLTFAAFDLATAQRVFDSPGAVDFVNVTAESGVSDRELQTRLLQGLGFGYEVEDAGAFAAQRGGTVQQFVGLFNAALLAFAAVGLIVGGFIIVNTFTILVAQRTRELGLLRALGASRQQVLGSVIGEAVLVGVVASVAGLAIGIAIAGGLLDLVKRFGLDVPDSGTVVLGRTIVVAIAVGLVMTVGSAIFPAVRAARTPPVAAIQDVAGAAPLSSRRRAVVGGLVLVLGLGTLATGMIVDPTTVFLRVAVIGVGALGAFLGVVVLLAVFAGPLAGVAGWPVVRVLATPGVLARRNATRNPRRTAATASALVVGLSLVCLVAIFAASTKASLRDAVDDGVRADLVLTNEQLGPLSSDVAARVKDLPDVAAASGIRLGQITVGSSTEFAAGVDAAALDDLIALDLEEGSERGLTAGAMLVHEREASDHDASVGEPLTVTFPGAGVAEVPVAGVYGQQNFIGGFPVPTFVLDREAFETRYGGTQRDSLVYVKARPGHVDDAGRQIEDALGEDFPNIRVQTRSEFADRQQDTVDRFVAVLVALLLLSELIAVLGIVNTLYLSVYERTRELGLLRVVGMSRRQVQTMVRGESVIIAIIGGVVGLAVGVFWGWAFTTALAREGITEFAVPFVQLLLFLVLSIVAGVVAALLPAWRAGRLDVLEAVTTE